MYRCPVNVTDFVILSIVFLSFNPIECLAKKETSQHLCTEHFKSVGKVGIGMSSCDDVVKDQNPLALEEILIIDYILLNLHVFFLSILVDFGAVVGHSDMFLAVHRSRQFTYSA